MKYITIGKILNTHGIKGELKVEVYTDFIEERFKKESFIYLGEKKIKETVLSYRKHNDVLLLKLKDKEDINLVEQYKNHIIYKNEEDIEKLRDAYFFRDFDNLDVYLNGELLGKVMQMERARTCDYLRVKTKNKEVLIPNLSNFIKNIDLENKRIDVQNLEGLL